MKVPQECETDERQRQPRGPFVHSWKSEVEFMPCSRQPIEQRRFFEPRGSVKTRRDPVARVRHFAADGGVARLVRSQESDSAQAAQIHHQQRHPQPVFRQASSIVARLDKSATIKTRSKT